MYVYITFDKNEKLPASAVLHLEQFFSLKLISLCQLMSFISLQGKFCKFYTKFAILVMH